MNFWEKIKGINQKQGRNLEQILNPGLTEKKIAQIENELPGNFPRDLRQLYLQNNGTKLAGDMIGKVLLTPSHYFLPIDAAMEFYRSKVINKSISSEYWPFFFDGSDGFLLCQLDCRNEMPSFIIEEFPEFGTRIMFRSIDEMFKKLLICYEKKLLYIDDEGFLELDEDNYTNVWGDPEFE